MSKITVGMVYDFINSIAPFGNQEDWDNSGLLIGDRENEVETVAFCLDVTEKTLEAALELDADLIISHHPIIWDPLKSVGFDSVSGFAIRNSINVISAHTNWDMAEGGVNDVLATMLGLCDVRKIAEEGELSMLRVGELKTEVSAEDFAEVVAESLETCVRLNSPEKQIKTIAVCGGSGACFLPDLNREGIDAYVTGDAKHNDFLDAQELGISLLAAGHYETETISVPVLMKLVETEFPGLSCNYIESAPIIYIG